MAGSKNKFRHRVGSSKLKQRVPKGSSSESNPSCRRHRNAVQAARGPIAASAEAAMLDEKDVVLQQLPMSLLNLGSGETTTAATDEDQKSMVSEGELSRISNFTGCTNPTFDAVHRVWKSGSNLQSDVVTILAAVAEIIRERGGEESSNCDYFAALLCVLETTPADAQSRIAATAYLLQMVAKKTSREVLQRCGSRAIEVLYARILEQAETHEGAVLKYLITAFGVVLRAQSASAWTHSSTKSVLVTLAQFCIHTAAWARTMARRVLRTVLTDPITSLPSGAHPAAGAVGQFCIQNRLLCLVEGVMHKMPATVFKHLAETMLRLLAFTDARVKCSVLQSLQRCLLRLPADGCLPIETNAQIILALRDLQPVATDHVISGYWMQTLAEAHVCLVAKDKQKNLPMMNESIELLLRRFDLDDVMVAESVCQAMERLIRCILHQEPVLAGHCLHLLDGSLSLLNANVWPQILKLESVLFEAVDQQLAQQPAFARALKTLVDLRDNDSCICKGDIDKCIGSAIRYQGVVAVLNVITLGVDENRAVVSLEFSRSWLLPILRNNIRSAPLSFFVQRLLPMAIKLHRQIATMEPVAARLYTTYQEQIWQLLPEFCASPSDFETAFPGLAPVLGSALTERSDLRFVVLASLRAALRYCMKPDASVERKNVISNFSRNYLPLLFNLYISDDCSNTAKGPIVGYDDRGVRLAALETIRLYGRFTSPDLIDRYIRLALEKIADPEAALEKKVRILDVLCSLGRFADTKALNHLLGAAEPWFHSTDAALQKKAFRLMEEIMKRKGEGTLAQDDFMEKNSDLIYNIMHQNMVSVAPSARPALITVYTEMISSSNSLGELERLRSILLPAIIQCLDRTLSVRLRMKSAKCLELLGKQLIVFGGEESKTPSTVLHPILETIYAASRQLDGKSELEALKLTCSSLVALNIVASKWLRLLEASYVSQLVAFASTGLGDGRTPVRLLRLRLLRILCKKLPDYSLEQFKDQICNAIFVVQPRPDLTHKVRKANRLLLEVLVDRLGVPSLQKKTDKADWLLQLKSIAKERAKKCRKALEKTSRPHDDDNADNDDDARSKSSRKTKQTAGADTILDILEDSDDEQENEDMDNEDTRSRRSASSVWLKEDDEDEVLDLLDRKSMVGKVTTTRPADSKKAEMRKKKKLEEGGGFQLSKDGRLVIENLDAELTRKSAKRRKLDIVMGDEKAEKSDEDEDECKTVSARSYRSGGRGIHRDLNAPPSATIADRKKQKADRNKKESSTRHKKDDEDSTKKQKKNVQPFAYISLRKNRGHQHEMRRMIKDTMRNVNRVSRKRKSGK